ncbi:hypothetical protein [Fredinandcohnia sp. 179-A 10B2 NHS]|uniref:hypothetical protein n=1 Tax=Fredinandcohnia sp. 179-A 10B2 NHS TaxID=3235176 RepID=UPI0039A11772
MYLTEVSLLEQTKKQFTFKVKAFLGSLTSLLTVQIVAMLFSLNGVGSMGMGGNSLILTIKSFSGNLVFFFSIFWAFIMAITLTTKPYRYMDFSFVTNRLSSHLSTIALLVLYSLIASVTAMLSGILLRVIMYFTFDGANIIGNHFFLPLSELLLGIYIGTLYIMLFATIGYFIGMFVQINKLFGFIIPAIIIGWVIIEQKTIDTFSGLTFFFHELSVLLFSVKVLVTVTVLLAVVIMVTNRLEVRK